MLLRDFLYELPDDRIARFPVSPRDQSRLLQYREGMIFHHTFHELPDLLPENTLLVFNDTRVIPARARLKKESGALIEILLLYPERPSRLMSEAMAVRGECVWECMVGNKKRWKAGDVLSILLNTGKEQVRLSASWEDRERDLVKFEWDGDCSFLELVLALGEIPLPPYLGRQVEKADAAQYQTVYARRDGAVAAPTAGLHFTTNVIENLQERRISSAFVTLHVGAGTFQPVKTEDIRAHQMHTEQVVYSRSLLNDLLPAGRTVVAVGTTSLRSLESLYWFGVKLLKGETQDFRLEKMYPYSLPEEELPDAETALAAVKSHMDANHLETVTGETGIFIFPGYRFRVVKGLVTNYHQPGSTLIMLVAAFVGSDWRRIYHEALEEQYRFLSYGDSSLLWSSPPERRASQQ